MSNNPIRRGPARRAMQTYVNECHVRGYYPTTDEVTDAGMDAAHASVNSVFLAFRRWMKYEAMSMLRGTDPATRLRRYLLELDSDGKQRWHPHDQMTFEGLDNAQRFVTRPQLDKQMRAERKRDIERTVLEQMEHDLGRVVTADEAWPRVQVLLQAEGLWP